MAHAFYHSVSSAKRWGGQPENYLPIHSWMDESKGIVPDNRHRALRHHAEGMMQSEQIFGPYIEVTIDKGTPNERKRKVMTQYIVLQHILEDFNGWVPTFQDWAECIEMKDWMGKNALPLSVEMDGESAIGKTVRPEQKSLGNVMGKKNLLRIIKKLESELGE